MDIGQGLGAVLWEVQARPIARKCWDCSGCHLLPFPGAPPLLGRPGVGEQAQQNCKKSLPGKLSTGHSQRLLCLVQKQMSGDVKPAYSQAPGQPSGGASKQGRGQRAGFPRVAAGLYAPAWGT